MQLTQVQAGERGTARGPHSRDGWCLGEQGEIIHAFHGTAKETVRNIKQDGFNRSFCGKNGTRLGKVQQLPPFCVLIHTPLSSCFTDRCCGLQGVYFARDSRYSTSTTYSPPDSGGSRWMFMCRILHGKNVAVSNTPSRLMKPKVG